MVEEFDIIISFTFVLVQYKLKGPYKLQLDETCVRINTRKGYFQGVKIRPTGC